VKEFGAARDEIQKGLSQADRTLAASTKSTDRANGTSLTE
jgi:hypothetical protein